jgi:hypothetical protein
VNRGRKAPASSNRPTRRRSRPARRQVFATASSGEQAWPTKGAVLPRGTRTRRPLARNRHPPRSCIRRKQRSRSRYRVPCIWAAGVRTAPVRPTQQRAAGRVEALTLLPSARRSGLDRRACCSSIPVVCAPLAETTGLATKRTSASCGRPAPPPPWPHARRRVRGPRPARRSPRRADLGWRSTAASWSSLARTLRRGASTPNATERPSAGLPPRPTWVSVGRNGARSA